MLRLLIDNSVCRFENIKSYQISQLRKSCSYQVVSKLKIRIKTKSGLVKFIRPVTTHHLMNKAGAFPTGLLYRVYNALRIHKIECEIIDLRVKPKLRTVKTTYHPLYPHSLVVSRKFEPDVNQTKAARAAVENERAIIVAPTGYGKSMICELIFDLLQVNTLIVVPGLGLKLQLTESLRQVFGHNMVGPLSKSCKPHHPITVENVDALDPKKVLEGFDCVIVDEFHHSAAVSYRDLNKTAWKKIYYKFGLTATPFRSNSEERLLLESVLSKVVHRITYEDALAAGRIVPMEAYFIDVTQGTAPEVTEKGRQKVKIRGSARDYQTSYKKDIIANKFRNSVIADITSNLIDQGIPTLVLTKTIQHGVNIQELLEQKCYDVPFAEGKSNLKEQDIVNFNEQRINALIGTAGVLGEGIDTKPAEWVILAGGGKSKNAFMQQCGRGFRVFGDKESCKILMFLDNNNKWLKAHFKQCVKYLAEEYNVIPQELFL